MFQSLRSGIAADTIRMGTSAYTQVHAYVLAGHADESSVLTYLYV
ncbi:hypothetical protein Mame_02907 [Martelella mediterranea DSM 17316]|uniref:Uncharacterized protein n=1 Tax=Martelella mediterranea DSM 17316 TaxID=1122214 RepID=A0A1U9Z3K7_9HYPH|nr:hypothetical protein Mame_02907 [Martelella mediterranea DSM 17316]